MCWLSWVWLGSHFGCDYTDYYYILVAAEWCKSLLYFLFCWVGWGCTGGWEGTQLGQLIPTDQKDIPYCLISCSAIKLPGFLSKDSLPRWSGHCSAYEIVWVNPFYSAFFPLPFFPSPSLSWSVRGFFAFSHPILPLFCCREETGGMSKWEVLSCWLGSTPGTANKIMFCMLCFTLLISQSIPASHRSFHAWRGNWSWSEMLQQRLPDMMHKTTKISIKLPKWLSFFSYTLYSLQLLHPALKVQCSFNTRLAQTLLICWTPFTERIFPLVK